MEHCVHDSFHTPYIELVGSGLIFVILQIWLLVHTLRYEYKSAKAKRDLKRIKLSIRILFLLLQILGIYWISIDLLRFGIDPYFPFLQNNNIWCGWAAFSPKIIYILYVYSYLHQISLRLKLAFNGSHLAITKRTWTILALLIFIPSIIIPIGFLVSVIYKKPCIWRWEPIDIAVSNSFGVCDYWDEGLSQYIIAIGVMWAVMANSVIGIIFGVKLNRVFKISAEDKKSSFKLKSLIIKNTILTIFGSISSIINWFLWIIFQGFNGIGIFFLYFDIWLNCLIIALMFKYNEIWYKKLCRLCIYVCFIDCDKTYNKNDKKQYLHQRHRTLQYLDIRNVANNNNDNDISIIFSQTEIGIPSTSPRSLTVPTTDIITTDLHNLDDFKVNIDKRLTPNTTDNGISMSMNDVLDIDTILDYKQSLEMKEEEETTDPAFTNNATVLVHQNRKQSIVGNDGENDNNDNKNNQCSMSINDVLDVDAILNEKQVSEDEIIVVYQDETEETKVTEPAFNNNMTVIVYKDRVLTNNETQSVIHKVDNAYSESINDIMDIDAILDKA